MKKLSDRDKSGAPIYVVHEHWATNHHFDLRLQAIVEGKKVLLSWAVPKGLAEEIGVKRLAIRTPNHEMSWATFQGVIPKGEYGAGRVVIWDKGIYIPKVITKTNIEIEIHGNKIKGLYQLSQLENDKWILKRIA